MPERRPGWTVTYTTDLTQEVWFYLRGEEYSAQIDYFVKSIASRPHRRRQLVRSALQTDRVVAMILGRVGGADAVVTAGARSHGQGVLARLFG